MSTPEMRLQFYEIAGRWDARRHHPVWGVQCGLLANNARTTAGTLGFGPHRIDRDYADSLLKLHRALLTLPNLGGV